MNVAKNRTSFLLSSNGSSWLLSILILLSILDISINLDILTNSSYALSCIEIIFGNYVFFLIVNATDNKKKIDVSMLQKNINPGVKN